AASLPVTASTATPSATTPSSTTPSTATPSTASPSTALPVTTSTTTAAVAATPGQCPLRHGRAQPRPDRSRYHLTADIRPAENTVTGSVDVQFTPDLVTDRLVLRLWPNGPVLAAAGAHLEPGPVTVDGQPAPSSRPNPTTLVVAASVAAGQTVDVALPWTLTLARPNEGRISRSGDSVRLGSFFPILAWEPGVGWATEPPTVAEGETATTAAADFTMAVTVPPGFDVLATGTTDGQGTWSAPAVPDVALTVGHFTEVTATIAVPQPVQVTVGVEAGVAESPQPYLAKVTKVLEQYSRRFGPYPWPAYTVAISPTLHGGIEYPMHVMQGPGSIGRSTSHEVGHQWFYGLVEDDQARDPRLDEALATWAEAGFEGTLAAFVSRPIPADAVAQAGRPMTFWDGHAANYYAGVYVQGAKALAALGPPDLVDCALAAYVDAHAYRVARPADLIGALRAVFPDAAPVLARYGLHP
ncbi:MAG: hypothetical protein QOG64_1264, partial [Acidimicrobiaceae bacterium]|nr:hypothetical protein [Acidimicrobiaceae bacterium]